jgi:sec-independent protein translocase protein TatB
MEDVAAPLNDGTVRFRSQVQLVDCAAMFNLSGSEIVFLLLLALIVLGPEKLPEAVRRFGKGYAEFKKMTTGFQSELKSALDEPMREMRETADAFKKAVNFDFDYDYDADGDIDQDDADAAAAADADAAAVASTAGEPSADDEPAPTDTPATSDEPTSEPEPEPEPTSEPVSTAVGNEPPIVRPPGPTFHSAAPQQTPKVVEALEPVETVEETASE